MIFQAICLQKNELVFMAKRSVLAQNLQALPFSEVARAFRRKRLLEDVVEGGQSRRKIIETSGKLLELIAPQSQDMFGSSIKHKRRRAIITNRAKQQAFLEALRKAVDAGALHKV